MKLSPVVEDAARLAAIVTGADDAIISLTLDGVITSWNRAAESLFGHSAAEAVGRSITLILPQERYQEEIDILARLSRGEMIQHFETERVARDGRRVSVSLSVSPIRDATGQVVAASKIARDITPWKRTERELQNTVRTLEVLYHLADQIGHAKGRADVYEAALDAITDGLGADRASVLLFDSERVMRFVAWRGLSDRYRAAVEGHSPWPPTGVPAPIVIDDAATDERVAGLRSVVLGEGIQALGFLPLSYDGRLLGKFMVYFNTPHAFSPAEIRLGGTIAQHVGFGLARVDSQVAIAGGLVRERRARREADAARAEAEAASGAKDEFLAMLAHELRNPLSAIVSSVAYLEGDAAGRSAAGERAVTLIGRQAEHLAHLIDDLFDAARIATGRIEIEREPVDLRAAVNLAVDAHRHRTDSKRQQVEVSLPAGQVVVLGDALRLQQVLGNLVNNASKYTASAGSIALSLVAEDGEAVLRVRDDGAGIPAEKIESIFDLFVQANPTLARTEGGLGIGLTLVRRVVELHGGTVTARSEGVGRGSEITVRLPLAMGVAPAPLPPVSAGKVSRRVLIIEDHDDGRLGLATLLEHHGHRVAQAANGAEGIRLAKGDPPEIVFVDVGLPDIDGYTVGRHLRGALGEAVRLVAFTGYGQPRDRERSVEAGFDAHLVKPLDPRTLMETLDRLAVGLPA